MKKLLFACALAALALPVLAKTDALSLIPNDAVSVGLVRARGEGLYAGRFVAAPDSGSATPAWPAARTVPTASTTPGSN